MFIESQWYSLDIDNHDNYSINSNINYNNGDTLITFQTSELIQHLKSRNKRVVPIIIDLECLDKQMSQEGKEFKEYSEWKAIHSLKHHKIINSDFIITKDNFKILLENLSILFNELYTRDEEEKTRFENIESKINKIIYSRQYRGININPDIAKQKCVEIEKEIYRIKNILQLEYNIFSPQNENTQLKYLQSKKYNVIKSFQYSFKVRRNQDIICNYFYDLLRNQNDLDSLIYMLSHWGGKDLTYPSFLGFGTISSRIVMRQPALQNLRRQNRIVIIPDDGKKFLYVDYVQFEAGILASMSDDDKLINLYNSDIYEDIADKLLGDRSKRSDAKVIFYRFMYGDNTLEQKAKTYFSNFSKLITFKNNIENEITQKTRIGTLEGNYRISLDKETSWSLSHVIQSNASLIYKKALIRVKQEILEIQFLIPMHDGTLYQVRNEKYDEISKRVENIYIEEFKKFCPKLNPRVIIKDNFS